MPLVKEVQNHLQEMLESGTIWPINIWQIKMEETSKQCTAFTVGNLGFFECDHMPSGLCNVPAMFIPKANAELPG